MPSLDGAVVLVTGANGGIGTHFVHEALARGAAKVYATARSPRAWGDERIVPLTLDVTGRASIDAAVAAAADVTVLVNNAGAIPPSASLLDVTEADIRANMETNFFGPVFLARAFAPVLAAKQGSILIDVHSVAGWYAFGGSARRSLLVARQDLAVLDVGEGGGDVVGVDRGDLRCHPVGQVLDHAAGEEGVPCRGVGEP